MKQSSIRPSACPFVPSVDISSDILLSAREAGDTQAMTQVQIRVVSL